MRRKGAFKYRMLLLDFFNKPIPKYDDYSLDDINQDPIKIKVKFYFGAFLIYLNAYLGSTSLGKFLIKYSPTKLLKKWCFFIYKFGGRQCNQNYKNSIL